MHRLRSRSSIHRFRFAAILLCVKCLLTPVAAGVLAYSLVVHDDKLAVIGMGMVVLSVILIILLWLVAARTNCPLCMTSVLARKKCSKHRHAKALLGSHRLRVALAILFRNSFRCPYCNEPTAMEVRNRNNHGPYPKG